jgi:DNA-binding CsgD family transcriptional regulator
MDFQSAFYTLSDAADAVASRASLASFVDKVVDLYELKNAVYYRPGEGTGPDAVAPLSVITYEDQWVDRYFEANYLSVDPVVAQGFTGLLPLDWAQFDKRPPRVKQLFGEAGDFGIGRQGLTFPIRGSDGEIALFSVTSDLNDGEWVDTKRAYVRDLQIIAHIIHSKASVLATGKQRDYKAKLTPRERECLTWCAVGKTSEDIATILGISEGVVRIHLQSAQHKLDCLNRTHTVAKAITHKLIFPDLD